MIRAVLDANIILSGLARTDKTTSLPAEVIRCWTDGDFELVTSEHIIQEVTAGFDKPYFRRIFSEDAVEQSIAALRLDSEVVALTGALTGIASHRHDDPVLETAIVGNVSYLVTGDRALLALGRFQGVAIVAPGAFLTELNRIREDKSEESSAGGRAGRE